MGAAWFASLEPRHHMRGRVRLGYCCRAGTPDGRKVLEQIVGGVQGVRRVRANRAARSLVIEFDPALTDADTLAVALLKLPPPELPAVRRRGVSDGAELRGVALSGAALVGSRALPAGAQTPVALAAALPVFNEAVDDLLKTGISSHVLEALAVAISIGRGDTLAANTTTFLLALGGYLEHSIERRSDLMLKHLLTPAAETVWVERGGEEVQVAPAAVVRGDTVVVSTGSVIPVDGTVLGGEALVNEATMTGESVPVTRRRGDRALSGTLVQEGRLRVYAEQVGHHAAAARIADFVEQSLQAKSETQLEAARMADRLVPMVLGLAGTTWLVSGDWTRVAAVLQADYSCALKLATPVAFKSAMARAGRTGTLVKGAGALERLAQADTFVFDKTGTLTSGDLRVTDAVAFDADYSSEDLINLAASVEEHYFHPLALAVVAAAHRLDRQQHFQHKEVEFIAAHGVASVVDGKRIVVGSRHFVEDDEGVPTADHADVIDALHQAGKTVLYIGFGGQLLGVLALQDELRENAAETVARLRRLGVKRVLMLTGDREDRAHELAARLKLDGYHAELLPEGKAAVLAQLSASGERIAFIGDGMNDAPALSGAHVGIAMHRGADVARLAADVVLLEDNIERVADAKALALAVQRLIDSNFKLTVGLNTAILLAAAFGALSPVSASVAHNGSTIAILLRALMGAGLPAPTRARAST